MTEAGWKDGDEISLVAVGTSVGAQAQHVDLIIDDTFQSDSLSAACGVAVFIDVVADLNATLVYNKSGLIVREIDPAGPGTITVRSPDTGKSFSYPFQGAHWDYGSGAVVGSDVIGSFTGVFVRVTGFLPPDAGLFRFKGFVEGFDQFVMAFGQNSARFVRFPDLGLFLCGAVGH